MKPAMSGMKQYTGQDLWWLRLAERENTIKAEHLKLPKIKHRAKKRLKI